MPAAPHPIDVPLWSLAQSFAAAGDLRPPVAYEQTHVELFGRVVPIAIGMWAPRHSRSGWTCAFEVTPFSDGVRLAPGATALESLERVMLLLESLAGPEGTLPEPRGSLPPPPPAPRAGSRAKPMVDLGGIVLMNPREDGRSWTVDLQHDFDPIPRFVSAHGPVSAVMRAFGECVPWLPETAALDAVLERYVPWQRRPARPPVCGQGDVTVWPAEPDGAVPIGELLGDEPPLAIPAPSPVESLVWGVRWVRRYTQPWGDVHESTYAEPFRGTLQIRGRSVEVEVGCPFERDGAFVCCWRLGDDVHEQIGETAMAALFAVATHLDVVQSAGPGSAD